MTSRVVERALDPARVLRGTEDPASGAVVVVTGAGTTAGAGASAAAADADRVLGALEDEALERFDVRRCRLRVRVDAPRGEPSVAAVVRAPHRRAAFDAARWAVSSALERLPGRDGP